MKNIYFIILNYNTTKETRDCVESIRKLDGITFRKKIILIDNCSTNGSFKELQESYSNAGDMFLYQMPENLGFSKANNYGYNIVREMGDADFCIVCNSDIIFLQPDFLLRLEQEYEKSYFHICGPDIYCKARQNTMLQGHQSPMYPFEWKKRYVKVYFLYNELMYKKIQGDKFAILKTLLIHIRWLCWKCIRKISLGTIYYNYRKKRHENVPVHGSCIILSALFLTQEKKLFLPETKFYGEELLLYLRSKKNDYKIVFNPEMVVEHLQGRATSSVKNDMEKDLFQYRHYMIAAKTYLEELEKIND